MAAKTKTTKRAAKKPAPKKVNPRSVRARAREEKALEMRAKGSSYAEIGRVLKISRQGARQLVRRAYEELAADAMEETVHARDAELARNDRIVLAWWDQMEGGDPKAAEIVLKALAQRHKILGLESTRLDLTVNTPPDLTGLTDAELATLEALMAKAATAADR